MNTFTKAITSTIVSTCFVLVATASLAEDTMKKDEPMHKDSMSKNAMTMKECKDHMAISKKGDIKDDAMMRTDKTCADMMKKDHMSKGTTMKKDGVASDPMKN